MANHRSAHPVMAALDAAIHALLIEADPAEAQTEETLALLKLLALGNQDIEACRSKPACAVIEMLRSKPPAA